MDSQAHLSAVVVSTTEPRSVVEECVAALRAGMPDCEIVLVDNGESEDRLGALDREIGNAKMVRGHGNVGYGRANNLGIAAATGTHVLVVNPDAQLVSADHEQLAGLLASDPFGIVAPLHLDPDGRKRYHVYPGDHWLVHFFTGQVLAPLQPRELGSRKRHASPDEDGAWVGGAFVLFRKDEFEALGGFDDRYFLYYDDRDITDRYRRAGLPVRADPSLAAAHGEGASFPDEEAGVRRSAWRIVGWLQYVYIWEGRRPARIALRALLLTYGAVAALLLAIPVRRLRRKGRELRAVRETVLSAGALLPEQAAGSYPDVLPLIAARAR
jgi:N-acetylglucosaminyl-diphospho-decaprenol L-rhamnosyltransferase